MNLLAWLRLVKLIIKELMLTYGRTYADVAHDIAVINQALDEELAYLRSIDYRAWQEENELMHIDHSVPIYDAVGCNECGGGYRGRTAIHEIIHCSGNISTLIANGASTEELERTARANGTKLLRDNVADLVQQGVTSMDELVRVTYAV